ncbi:hypothetical protein [Rhodanobacter lindaniclasticus]
MSSAINTTSHASSGRPKPKPAASDILRAKGANCASSRTWKYRHQVSHASGAAT